MDVDKTILEIAINMLDEIVECHEKGYCYPFCLGRTKEKIIIPEKIDGNILTSYMGMFMNGNNLGNSKVTVGYARTQDDANRFNASNNKPAGLTFVVK